MSKHDAAALLRFVDDEWTSIDQALLHIAATNDDNAALIHDENPAVARVLRESAESWRSKARRLTELVDALAESDIEWLDDRARGWVR